MSDWSNSRRTEVSLSRNSSSWVASSRITAITSKGAENTGAELAKGSCQGRQGVQLHPGQGRALPPLYQALQLEEQEQLAMPVVGIEMKGYLELLGEESLNFLQALQFHHNAPELGQSLLLADKVGHHQGGSLAGLQVMEAADL
ncbi:uncharacterized protein LOC116655325 [Drosophila ananassae]|uniref:uncharacterized protein LOC116655325 n=1 Tax=Drosophila ananassae TaxID=7217 RepID=UPI0013A5EBB8|nr:uncharacterized protein LOC116655325 [Drosophila ananassae]